MESWWLPLQNFRQPDNPLLLILILVVLLQISFSFSEEFVEESINILLDILLRLIQYQTAWYECFSGVFLSLQSGVNHWGKSVRICIYSGPYFPAFGLNTGRYSVSLRIQSECEKIRTRITPNTDTFHGVNVIIRFTKMLIIYG